MNEIFDGIIEVSPICLAINPVQSFFILFWLSTQKPRSFLVSTFTRSPIPESSISSPDTLAELSRDKEEYVARHPKCHSDSFVKL